MLFQFVKKYRIQMVYILLDDSDLLESEIKNETR